jgi:uncharacterized protein (TIGR00304 family)
VLDLVTAGLLLILVGFVAVAISLLYSSGGRGRLQGGGVVLIGPIPVVFGSDAKWAAVAVALALVLMVVILLVYGA